METCVFASVILTTYNMPQWLEKSLWGFVCQTNHQFELLVADDGSTEETARVIQRVASRAWLKPRHVWHADCGFRKSRIVNLAIREASGDYLIFSDGDCIPRRDFVGAHLQLARPQRFLSGGMVRLPRPLSQRLAISDIISGAAHSPAWLKAEGMSLSLRQLKLLQAGRFAKMLDALTTTRPSLNGHNASAWKADVIAANGFDERMEYGGLDRELGERLVNAGILPIQIRHRAICVHLDHDRAYIRAECLLKNREIRRETSRTKAVRTEFGIDQLSPTENPANATARLDRGAA